MKTKIALAMFALAVAGCAATPKQKPPAAPTPQRDLKSETLLMPKRNAQLKATERHDLHLEWDANSESNLAGYRVHWGPSSRSYVDELDVGDVTDANVGLAPGIYFLAVTAYNTAGLESDPSNEVSAAVPTPSPTPTPNETPTPTPTLTPTPSPAATPTPTPVATASPVPSVTATPSPVHTPSPTVAPTGSPTPRPAALANVSTRARVGTDDDVLIAGTIITGNSSARVIVRAIGPSLPMTGKLANPTLELRNSSGALIASNDDWITNRAAIEATTVAPKNDRESAIVAVLSPGAYTAIVRGKDEAQGVALVEVYLLK